MAVKAILDRLPSHASKTFGVFANVSIDDILKSVSLAGLSAIQLHGDESPSFCKEIKERAPELEVIKALRLRTEKELVLIEDFRPYTEAILLDTFVPGRLGGTGVQNDFALAFAAKDRHKIVLSGGLNAENVAMALSVANPFAIDLSSGVEDAPGVKSSQKLKLFFEKTGALA